MRCLLIRGVQRSGFLKRTWNHLIKQRRLISHARAKTKAHPDVPPMSYYVFAHLARFASRAKLWRAQSEYTCSCCAAALELPACTPLTHSNAYISLHIRVVIRPLSLAWDHPSLTLLWDTRERKRGEVKETLHLFWDVWDRVCAQRQATQGDRIINSSPHCVTSENLVYFISTMGRSVLGSEIHILSISFYEGFGEKYGDLINNFICNLISWMKIKLHGSLSSHLRYLNLHF